MGIYHIQIINEQTLSHLLIVVCGHFSDLFLYVSAWQIPSGSIVFESETMHEVDIHLRFVRREKEKLKSFSSSIR